jgi:hypothetical protein
VILERRFKTANTPCFVTLGLSLVTRVCFVRETTNELQKPTSERNTAIWQYVVQRNVYSFAADLFAEMVFTFTYR